MSRLKVFIYLLSGWGNAREVPNTIDQTRKVLNSMFAARNGVDLKCWTGRRSGNLNVVTGKERV